MKTDSRVRVLVLIMLFAGRTLSARAATPRIEPSRSTVEEVQPQNSYRTKSHFIGHYGETLSYSSIWVLHATFLRDGIEVVRFHSPDILPDPDIPPRGVKASDFEKVENFTPLKLAQLLVIPHQDSGFDLEELRAKKVEELRSQGTTFEVQDAPLPVFYWPKNTFEVYVTAPYRLHQVYAASEGKLFILTGGLDEEKGLDHFFSAFFAGEFVNSLGGYFEHLHRVPFTPPPETFDALDGFARLFLPLFAVGLLLLGLPWKKQHTRPVAEAALSAAALGWVLLAGGYYLARALSNAGRPGLIAPGVIGWMLFPLILSAVYYRTRGLDRAWRWAARAFSVLAALILVAFGMDTQRRIASGQIPVATDFSTFMCWVGVFCGACYGLSRDRARKSAGAGGMVVVAFLLLVGHPTAAPAQDLQDELEAKITVGKRSQDGKTYKEFAEDELKKKGGYFKYQRVEITGIVADDDTNKFAPGMFDLVLHPSRNDDGSGVKRDGVFSRLRRLVRGPNNALKDINDLLDTKTGKLSPRALEILKPLMKPNDVHAKEIVAHSWGAVLLNVAIREGLIYPPEHIIVVGVPDSDVLKWALLADNTGTKVDIVSSNHDVAVKVAEYADKFQNLNILGKQKDYSDGKTHEAWARWGKKKTNQRLSQMGNIHFTLSHLGRDMSNPSGHARSSYYDELKSNFVMERYTADQLSQMQTRRIETRALELMEADIQREIRSIRKRRGITDEDPPPAGSGCHYIMLGGQQVCIPRAPVARDAVVVQPSQPLQSRAVPAVPVARIPFYSIFPRLKDLAQAACTPGASIPLDKDITDGPPIYFSDEADDRAAERLSAGIGNCDKLVFKRLIAEFRKGQNNRISAAWIRGVAAEYTPPPPPIYSAPPRRENRKAPKCPPCEWIDGVRACPVDC